MSNLLGTLLVKMALDASEFERNLQTAGGKLQNVGASMQKVGAGLTMGVTLPMIGVGIAATKMATDYNASLANIASLGVPTDRIDEFKGAIQDMAIEVGKMPEDLAAGMYQVVSAFGDSADSLAILNTNARAAAAGLATTTEAINLTSAVTKGYGDTSAVAVQHAADLAFETVKLGQTTFPELAASIGLVTPLAASLGVAQEELFGVMATGTGVTGTASQVATQLRGVLQALMSPTKGMTELLASMGYESGQAMLEQLGLQGTIDTLVKAAADSGVPLQNYISSIEGQTLALSLAGEQSATFTAKLEAMTDVSGAVDEAFQAQTEGINATGFQMQQVQAKVTVLSQKLGDGLAPAILKILDKAQPMIDWLIDLANQFANADETTQTWILAITGIVAAAGPVIGIIGTLTSAIGGIVSIVGGIGGASSLIGGLGAAFAALGTVATGPIGLAIAAIAALALAWTTDFMGIRTATEQFMADIGPAWADFTAQMQSDWESGAWWTNTQAAVGQAGANAQADIAEAGAIVGDWWNGVMGGGGRDGRNINVTQNFNGAADAALTRRSTEAGMLDALRAIGGR